VKTAELVSVHRPRIAHLPAARAIGDPSVKVFARHWEVADPSLVLLRVKNSGFASVSEADIKRPITFTFPHREVREFTVTDCRGVAREDIQSPGAVIIENRILLPRFAMKRRASFKLLVLLSGTGGGVHGKGYIRRGQIVRETRGRGRLARNIVFGALLAGLQAGVTFSQAAEIPSFCHAGRPGPRRVSRPGRPSGGRDHLRHRGEQASRRAQPDYGPAARDVLRTITNWRQVGGADLPVRLVGRTSESGTRRAFDDKVLGGRDEPQFSSYDCVSKNAVPSSPVIRCEVPDTGTLLRRINTIPGTIGCAPGSLPADFLSYLNTGTSRDILRGASYNPVTVTCAGCSTVNR
jgi:hypothetical protein